MFEEAMKLFAFMFDLKEADAGGDKSDCAKRVFDDEDDVELIESDKDEGDDVDEFDPHDLFSLFIIIGCFS